MTTMTKWGPARPPDEKICETCGFVAKPDADNPQSVHRAFDRHWTDEHRDRSRLGYREVYNLTPAEVANGKAFGVIPTSPEVAT